MSQLSGTIGTFEIRLKNHDCRYWIKANVRVSKTAENPNQPYYYFRENKCESFRGWCESFPSFTATSPGDIINLDTRQIGWQRLVAELKEEVTKLKEDIRMAKMQLEKIEIRIGYLKSILLILIVLFIFINMKIM